MTKERELLRRALDAIGRGRTPNEESLSEEIRAYLAAEKEAEPLPSFLTEQEPLGEEFSRILNKHRWDLYERGGREYQLKPAEKEAEPIGWISESGFLTLSDKAVFSATVYGEKFYGNNIPLYLHPPKPAESAARKPMTEEELAYGFTEPRHSQWQAFVAGARWAEKHHGISEEP